MAVIPSDCSGSAFAENVAARFTDFGEQRNRENISAEIALVGIETFIQMSFCKQLSECAVSARVVYNELGLG